MKEVDLSCAFAQEQDDSDSLKEFRGKFLIPNRGELRRDTFAKQNERRQDDDEPCTYLCGNSLGIQPKQTRAYMQQYLDTWATQGVFGHFKPIRDSKLETWLHADGDAAVPMAKIVGASPDEVAVMQTLTMNLHLMMVGFYKPTKRRRKIIIEAKAFPSDHYAVQSQLRHHGFDPVEDLVIIEPMKDETPLLSTKHITKTIDEHADDTALLLLPGIQFYTGQLFDIPYITKYAQDKDIIVGWDLAHAVGNVPLKLHDWNVDFAAWCTYKYLNCGPGAIGGCFVHNRHGQASASNGHVATDYRNRLSGWWGSSKSSRFAMTNVFEPIDGAAGFQLSNPSIADLTCVRASLDIFTQTSMEALREKSLKLTGYLEQLLDQLMVEQKERLGRQLFNIITPRDPAERGAQLSVSLSPGLLDNVLHFLEDASVVIDERKPDVIRVAPAPLYNNFTDVWRFVEVFRGACEYAVGKSTGSDGSSLTLDGGSEAKGWSEVK